MFRKLSKIIAALALLIIPFANYGQVPNFGSLAKFALFTTSGAVGNTAVSNITGNIGANAGAITGFGAPSNVNGTIYNADGVTAQCVIDLQEAYDQLSTIPTTNSAHAPAFGGGETLFAGVYSIGGAASVAGTLILDAQGDPNAIFIFKIAGAFTTGASATVVLANGVSACHVFWVAEGAISMATLTTMKGTLIAHPGAVSMGALCNLEGRMFSTTGAVSVYGVVAINGCIAATTWTGAAGTPDWYTTGNWDQGVPGKSVETMIPSTLLAGRFFPVINTGVASVDKITIVNPGTLTVTNSTLQINSEIISTGTTDADSGTIEMTGSSGQTIEANTFLNNALDNLVISNTSPDGVTLGGALDIYGSLTYSGTDMKLVTNDHLTLKSTVLNTARVGNMTGDTIAGEVIVERYIPNHKAWQFLAIPTNTTQTVKQSWQEGANNMDSDLVKGYGTQITGPGGTLAGFDIYSSISSMKSYNSATNSWIGIADTKTLSIKSPHGYMTFIRGDRTANSVSSSSTPTVLRTKGSLFTGNQDTIFVNANTFASIGNPYASPLNMNNISKPGMKDFFYLWDPYLGGNNGFGGYQTFSNNGGDYVITPGGGSYDTSGSVSNHIQSGQAFLIQADNNGGNITFDEDSKAGGVSAVSRPAQLPRSQLRINLYGLNADKTVDMIDGILIDYDNSYSNGIDAMDAVKIPGTSENLSIKNANTLLVIERRRSITQTDTIFLNLNNAKVQQYRFQLLAQELNTAGLTGFLEDAYLNTRTRLNLDGLVRVDFSVSNMAGSYAVNRFRIVFGPALVLPLSFTSMKAYQKNAGISIEWKVEDEINITQYEVERSKDGIKFTNLSVIAATGNMNQLASYQATDSHPVEGYNYYRVKSINLYNKIEYTNIVRVWQGKGKQEITIYPNPVIKGVISVQLNNMPAGKYSIKLINNLGQKILGQVIQHPEGSSTHLIPINKMMPHNVYQVEIVQPDGNMVNIHAIY